MPRGVVSICQVSNQLSGKLVNVHAFEVIELLSLVIEDGRAKDDRYEDTTAVEYFSVHDLPPYRGPRGVSLRFRISRDSANDLLTGALSWFEFIDFRRDIVVSSLFSHNQSLQKAAPKITLRCVALTGSDAGNVPTKPAIKFPSISRSALAASLGSSGCLSSGAGLNFSTI